MSTAESILSPQLESLARDYHYAATESRSILLYHDEDLVRKRPAPSNWSPLECLVHLNLSAQAMLPGIHEAIDAAAARPDTSRSYRMDLAGRLLAWSLEPPAFLKMKTTKIAEPLEAGGPSEVLAEFEQLHNELFDLLHASAGKAIDAQKMKSPFANVHYNAYSAFRIIAAHDRRHLWQARKALTPQPKR